MKPPQIASVIVAAQKLVSDIQPSSPLTPAERLQILILLLELRLRNEILEI